MLKCHFVITGAIRCSSIADNNSVVMLRTIGQLRNEIFGFRILNSPKLSVLRLSSNNAQVLPKLPVPPLQQTLDKYLKSLKPHLNNDEMHKTKDVIKQFAAAGGIGQKLQSLLEKRAAVTDNWLADWWLQSAYLDFRWPVVVYSNPGLVFPMQQFQNKDEQLSYAANMILAALDYKSLIDNDGIPLEKMGKEPLDMGQYKKIFGTCRIPGLTRDRLSYNNSKHIAVLHNGHFFALPLWGEDNVILNADQIIRQLKDIISASGEKNSSSIGILTSEYRDQWGKVYEELMKDKTNASNLKSIEQSIFVICLDSGLDGANKPDWERQTQAASVTIHGGGSTRNSGNRWFDKTIQFIVTEDGINGLTYEHSPAEGQPIAVLADHIVNYITQSKASGKPPSNAIKGVQKLDFTVSSTVQAAINDANKNMDKLVSGLELNCFTFKMYGKDFIKSQKMSPDSYIQMAMQFAFYRLHNVPAAHYESAATRKYIGGRTETIRSCSEESVNFARTMLDKNASVQNKVQAMQMAIKSHKDYSLQAVNGLGVDRHLLGLKLTAIENGIEVPKLYSDAGFVKSTHMRISTSQVALKSNGFMCYGPLVPDGYATCYNPRPSDINFATSAFNEDKGTSAVEYRKALEDSLMDMHNVLLKATPSKL